MTSFFLNKTGYFLLLILFFTTQEAFGQGQRFNAGLSAGLTAAQLNGDQSAGYHKVGITGGIRGIIDLNEKWNLNTEIIFSQRGSRYPTGPNSPGIPFNITTSYIDVPVYATIGDWLSEDQKYYRIQLDLGAAFGRLIGVETIDTPFDNNPEEFQKTDLYVLAGVRYMLNAHLAFNFRYNRSIVFLFNNQKSTLNQRSLLSHFLTLKLEYIF